MNRLLLLLFTTVIGENLLLSGYCADRNMLKRRSFATSCAAAGFSALATIPSVVLLLLVKQLIPNEWIASGVAILVTSFVTLAMWLLLDQFFPTFSKDVLSLDEALCNLSAPAIVLMALYQNKSLGDSFMFAVGSSLGVLVVTLFLQLLYRRVRLSRVNRSMRGLPIALLALSLLSFLADSI